MEGLSIIVPAYQEEGAVGQTLEALIGIKQQLSVPVEIILVDDASTDGTGERADAFPEVIVIRKQRNAGYGAAIKTGLRRAKYEWAAITDADGSYPNDEIPALFAACGEADMVVGARTGADVTYSKIRAIPKIFLRRYVQWIAQRDIPDMNSGLRIFRRDLALRYLPILPNGFSFTTTITLALMCNEHIVAYRPINYFARIGSSHIRPIRDTLNFFQLIGRTGIYFAPMRLFMPLSATFFAFFLLSLGYDLFFEQNLGDKTVLLLTFAFNVGLFGALADMIRKTSQIR